MPLVRRAALLALLLLLPLALAVPAAVPKAPGGHYDDLGVWVPDERPSVTFLPGPDLGAYRNHSEMASYLLALEQQYPGYLDRFSLGQSVRGLDLWAMVVTDESVPGPKPKILIDAAHHGDEVIGTEIALRLARDLLTEPALRPLLEGRETWIVPMANPDGVTLIPQASHYATARKNANSVDTNRNYDYRWGGPGSGGPGSDTYRGPSAFSEPETQAIRDVLLEHDFLTYVSIHSGAEIILWPWGWTTRDHHERAAYDELGDQLTALTGGIPNGQTSQILYTASGVSLDYGAGAPDKLRPFTFSPETYQGSGNAFDWWFLFNPPDHQIEAVYQVWKPALLKLLEVAPEYTAATLSASDLQVSGETFLLPAELDVPGKRGFRNASAVLHVPPQLELFSTPSLLLGDVLQGQVREPSWLVQANANGTYQVVVRALSNEAAGNLTRIVTVEARDVVKYVEVARPVMGAFERNELRVTLGGFGLTGVTGRLKVVADDGEVFFDENVSVPDGGSLVRSVPFDSGDRPPGRTVVAMTFDLTGTGPDGPVARHVEQRAAYSILRPDLVVSKSLPLTASPTRAFSLRTTLTNVGQLPTQGLVVVEEVPLGYLLGNGQVPTAAEPLKSLARPAPSLVLPGPDGNVRLVWENLTLAAGGVLTFDLRLTATLPGEHAFRTAADYSMTQLYDPERPAPTRLHDEAAATQTVG